MRVVGVVTTRRQQSGRTLRCAVRMPMRMRMRMRMQMQMAKPNDKRNRTAALTGREIRCQRADLIFLFRCLVLLKTWMKAKVNIVHPISSQVCNAVAKNKNDNNNNNNNRVIAWLKMRQTIEFHFIGESIRRWRTDELILNNDNVVATCEALVGVINLFSVRYFLPFFLSFVLFFCQLRESRRDATTNARNTPTANVHACIRERCRYLENMYVVRSTYLYLLVLVTIPIPIAIPADPRTT